MFYITEDNKLLNYADIKYSQECKYTDIITQRELDLFPNKVLVQDNVLVLNPDFEEQELKKAKEAKYEEANIKANMYLQSGEALFEFQPNKHIEATDGNIAKLGLSLAEFLFEQDMTSTIDWNTKEDETVQLNALDLKAIVSGLKNIQTVVWTVKYPRYLEEINKAETVEEVKNIEIDYTKEAEPIAEQIEEN